MDSNTIINTHQKLPEWVANFDKKFLSKLNLGEKDNKYFKDTYNSCAKLRNDFRNNFLPKLDSELPFPSSPAFHKYEYYFRTQEFPEYELSQNYIYDEKINLIRKSNRKKAKKEEEKINVVENKKEKIQQKKIENNINYLKQQKEKNININRNDIINKGKNKIKYPIKENKKNEMIDNINNKNNKDSQYINKNRIVNNKEINNKNRIGNYNNKYKINDTFKKNENKYSINKEKQNNIIKNINQKNINKAYNKKIIPIKEVVDEEELSDVINKNENKNNKKMNKIQDYSNHNHKNSNEINNMKNILNNNLNNKNDKNYNKKQNISKSSTFVNKINTRKEPIKVNQKNFKVNKSIKASENLNLINKRNSIKNYLMSKKPRNLEENKDEYKEKSILKISDNINHSRIKNYLRNKI